MLDTGLLRDGYFCDFNRNFVFGVPQPALEDAHEKLLDAVEAAFAIACPGVGTRDLFSAMNRIVNPDGCEAAAGRLGHGLGLQLTESPSLVAEHDVCIASGMVLTLEPVIQMGYGKILVHEENIVVRDSGPEYLSRFRRQPVTRLG